MPGKCPYLAVTALAALLGGCQGTLPRGDDAIPAGTRLHVDAPLTLAVSGHGTTLQGGRQVTAREQTVWSPACRLRTEVQDQPRLTLEPGTLEVARVSTHWDFREISISAYSARLELARPFQGITVIDCEVWAGPQWQDGRFGLTELKAAVEPLLRVDPGG